MGTWYAIEWSFLQRLTRGKGHLLVYWLYPSDLVRPDCVPYFRVYPWIQPPHARTTGSIIEDLFLQYAKVCTCKKFPFLLICWIWPVQTFSISSSPLNNFMQPQNRAFSYPKLVYYSGISRMFSYSPSQAVFFLTVVVKNVTGFCVPIFS